MTTTGPHRSAREMNPRVRYLLTTLALVGIAVAWNVPNRPTPPRPPRPASSPAVAAPRPAPIPPTANDLLARGQTLALTIDQRARLEALAARWRPEVAGLEAEVRGASEEFARFMAEAEARGRVRLDEIRARSLEVQDLAIMLRERRVRHSEEAIAVLTERQRVRLAPESGIAGGKR